MKKSKRIKLEGIESDLRRIRADIIDLRDHDGLKNYLDHQLDKLKTAADDVREIYVQGGGTGND